MAPAPRVAAACVANRGGAACSTGRSACGAHCRPRAQHARCAPAPPPRAARPALRLNALRDLEAPADGPAAVPPGEPAPQHAAAAPRRRWFARRAPEGADVAPAEGSSGAEGPLTVQARSGSAPRQRGARGWLRGATGDPPVAPPPTPPGATSAPATSAQRPADSWDLSWPRRSTPLFSAAASPRPVHVRPAWLPQWADPLDDTSDFRRWILPFILAPYLAAQFVKFAFLVPVFTHELHVPGSRFFRLTTEQTERYEAETERYRAHLAFEQLLERAPPLSDAESKALVRQRLAELEEEGLEANCAAVTDLVADATFVAAASANVAANLGEVKRVRSAIGREFFSLDSSRQAFVLLLVSDILVGYHSSEGWETMLALVSAHYGIDERKDLVALFVATVPVSLDVLFKFWCFKSLRELSPDTQVILDDIDRH